MSVQKRGMRELSRNRSGSIAIIGSLVLFAIFGVVGLSVDFARGSSAKSALQAAADAAALGGARTVGTPAQREAAATAMFNANLPSGHDLKSVVLTPTNIVLDGTSSGYRVAATAQVPATFGSIFGMNDISVSVVSEANGGIRTPTEVVLVLDTTASMAGWKMTTLKEAATSMIDDLNALSTAANPIRYGVVPFSQYVNVGMANRNKLWMNVPADWTETVTPGCYDEPEGGWINCVQTPRSGTCYSDGVPYTCTWTDWSCQPAGPMKKVCPAPYQVQHRWYGCAGSRNYPLNIRDENYGTRIPGVLDVSCGAEMLDLTTSATNVKNHIAALITNGDTYIPSGLIWGWRMLTPQDPLAGKAITPADDVRKFMILMTDGLNTRSPSYPSNEGWDGAQANTLTSEVCANIAADKTNAIRIYSIAFDVTDAATKTILQNCATASGGQFFDAKNAVDFKAVFKEIGGKISELRLSR
ncbi:MAG: pilus assembly protein TadG-related protein [Proteobacteria bacterium]|nr:pilus assembly protein TadG-related protein [Pseudomonadota bacterium]